jgi:hypothetical protein
MPPWGYHVFEITVAPRTEPSRDVAAVGVSAFAVN